MTAQVSNWLLSRAEQTPDGLALRCDGESLNFGQLATRVDETAVRLHDLGVRLGDRVAILASGLDFVHCLHALTRLGAIAVPLNARLLPDEHRAQLETVSATRLLFSSEGESAAMTIVAGVARDEKAASKAMPRIRDIGPGYLGPIRYVTLCGGTARDSALFDSRPPHGGETVTLHDTIDLEGVHSVIFTSGTTGGGKAVALTHGNHWWSAFGSALNLGSTPEDVWLNCLPLYHVGGLSMLMKSVLYGVPVVVHSHFDPADVNSALDSGRVTLISLVSTMLSRLIEERNRSPFPPSLRCILLGGGPIPPSLVETCLQINIPIAPTWGMTETASQATTLRPSEPATHIGSSGRALIGVDIAIDRLAGNGNNDGPGELIAKGPSVTPGYVFPNRSEVAASYSSSQWFHTGDIGSIDRDGYLTVADRSADLIVSGGENILPSEVERVLGTHPGVRDVAVFGLPDSEWGQIVAAAVVPRSQAEPLADLPSFCRARLANYKCPRVIRIVSELPRTASGKLRRIDLIDAEFITSATEA